MASSSGYGSDGIYRSSRPPITFHSNPSLSMVPFLFNRALSADAGGDRLALADADSGEALSFSELAAAVSNVAAGLARLGIQKGDVVLLFAPNSLYFPIAFLATVCLGAIATTANPVYTISELSKQVRDAKPKLVITVPQLWPKVAPLRLPVVIIDPQRSSLSPSPELPVIYWVDLAARPAGRDFSPPLVAQSDVAALLYSSGTTGLSKGVSLTHGNFITTALMATLDQDYRGEPSNTFLCFLPMFHVFGLSVITYAQLTRGNSIVSMARFDMDSVLRAVEKYRVTYMFCVPPVMIGLAKQGKVTKYDLSSLKFIGSGAAPLGKEVMEEVSKNYPYAEIVQGYGMTETCGIISLEYTVVGQARQFGSTGILVSGVEAKVVCLDTLKPRPPNEVGELCVRGPNIMQGYINNSEATKLTLDEEGWLHTGDTGYFDEKGQLYVVDRIKELIKCYGFQVAPAELEGLLLSHPEIRDAAVVGFPDVKAGEVPIAYVVRSPESSLTEEDVQKFIADQVAPFKRLRSVTFVDSVPRAVTGKLLRRLLVDKARSKL